MRNLNRLIMTKRKFSWKIAYLLENRMHHKFRTLQVEFAGGGALRCGEYVTLRKVGDASHKVSHRVFHLRFC